MLPSCWGLKEKRFCKQFRGLLLPSAGRRCTHRDVHPCPRPCYSPRKDYINKLFC